jgi:endonuclease/exonuclease/phosphatase family metal-dependent hydrolase
LEAYSTTKFRLAAKLFVLLLAVAVFATALPSVASAGGRDNDRKSQKHKPSWCKYHWYSHGNKKCDNNRNNGAKKVTFMTRNVYLGADLGPALAASTIPAAVDGGGVIWAEVQATNFPERAVPLAKELDKSDADLIGLQEVALWRTQTPSDLGGPPLTPGTSATTVAYDFLALLLAELDKLGGDYEVVHVQEEFDAELPVDVDANDATGSPPFGAELDVRLTMRDVILRKKDSKVQIDPATATGAHYQTLFTPLIGGALPLPVKRGWQSVEASFGGKNEDKFQFRFVNTHLEAFGEDTIREAQAKELFDGDGPLNTPKQVVLVGDLNSGTEARHNIHDTDQLAFQALLGFGMTDNGAIHSCCYSDMFDPTEVFDHTVDHVLTKPGLKTVDAFVTGNNPAKRTPSGLWPSDHGGVVSTVKFKK